MALGVGRRETTAEIARASDETGAKGRGVSRKPKRLDGGNSVGHARVRDAREQQILPYRESDAAVAELLRNARQPPCLGGRQSVRAAGRRRSS